MTLVFSVTWQTFRLGLRPSPPSLAALSTLRTAFTTAALSKLPLHHFCGVSTTLQCSKTPLRLGHGQRITTPKHVAFASRLQQSRWASALRRKSKQVFQNEQPENDYLISRAEINVIFGERVDQKEGNDILVTLQKHRCAGTLDHDFFFPKARIAKGLKYLRAKYPVDEDAAIIARVDKEAYKDFRLPQTDVEQSPYAESQFAKLRERNENRAKEEDEVREAKEKMEARERPKTSPNKTLVQRRPDTPEWIKKYRNKPTLAEVPEMSNWARLLPSAGVVVTVIALSVLFAQNYIPPSRKARLWPDLPPAAATLITIIGVNVAVFLMWRVPPFWAFLNRSFLVVPAYPYAASMIAASFSHQSFTHLFSNMVGTWIVGTRLHDDIGRGPFLALYFSSAVVSAFIPMAFYVFNKFWVTSTLGASGVVCSMIATSCVLHEGRKITLPFLPPEWTQGIDTGFILALLIIVEIVGLRRWGLIPLNLVNSGQAHIDHMGHLSGYAAGIAAASLVRSTDPKWKNIERSHLISFRSAKRNDTLPLD